MVNIVTVNYLSNELVPLSEVLKKLKNGDIILVQLIDDKGKKMFPGDVGVCKYESAMGYFDDSVIHAYPMSKGYYSTDNKVARLITLDLYAHEYVIGNLNYFKSMGVDCSKYEKKE